MIWKIYVCEDSYFVENASGARKSLYFCTIRLSAKCQLMKAVLRKHIIEQLDRTPPRLDYVLDHFQEIKTEKNEVLVEVGQVCRYVYFIVEGCLKISAYNRNGDESTTDLAFEYDWKTAMRSFVNHQSSNERIVCVEPSQLLAISRSDFQKLSGEIPEFEYIYKNLLEESYTQSIERVQTLMNLDALNRLKWLLSIHPLIFTRLSNRLIASYLSISEATLSRLKAKL